MALRWGEALLRGVGRRLWARETPRLCSTETAPKPLSAPPSPYQERPWEYLESEEYRMAYGDKPVWQGYRRNYKGSIPPQHTRKTCVRKGKPVGNPCPICRDRNLHVHFQNVKLLDQFICPHSGVIFHPTHTGICMKQHKLLTKAIAQAQDHGLLWLQVPYVPVPRDDFSNRHAAVSRTPAAPALAPGQVWYPWYERQPPPPTALARLRRLYKGFLKEERDPAAAGASPGTPPTPPAQRSTE
ncbi:28S ribosomal protein S18b, mitochondrial [Cuculus canorus]|uniref:28S ribosomal protein S18b, mitochondrial n=1 Tax=Cuculus canorus TaxID=55661 RepID=UPI0023AA9418|nr:28S ribosomal protein S18b, mitochondrial [Cuculus canorus]